MPTGAGNLSKKGRRRNEILAILADEPTMRVKALASRLDVTTETIRRDLEELAEQGLISRTYGGAMLRAGNEPVLSQRERQLVREREAIARRAFVELAKGKTFLIGSGATTAILAKRLAFELRNVTVIAHSFAVATALAQNPTIRTIMVPGEYHAAEGAMHGAQAIRFLQDYTADWAILGASALSPDGPSDALIEAAEVYATMLRQSSRSMIVADHSKFDRMSTARYAEWSQIECLVTDRTPDGPLARALDRNEVRVMVADKA
ncbi:DeoR/GlpR family DNA-binding transcription regulator [Tropicimonas sediminicola]|uniref:Transcriptional regulator, DeoR family n=1 Tax=Tropicimonas sediminicola TaxID=1031541 RepID=A0A239CC90_9RHOB|nr:DeoR/GlpR family DNA-binding transcription regulator [Tropicimonas sediminicola]SNS17074.1 transcriptional regulator, DeoR family [Tropicimonas sediminicola]